MVLFFLNHWNFFLNFYFCLKYHPTSFLVRSNLKFFLQNYSVDLDFVSTKLRFCKIPKKMKKEELNNAVENTQLTKFLDLKKILSSESQNADQIEIEFNRIILEELDAENVVRWLKNGKSLPLQLKPFLLDNLKRIMRFDSIIKQLSIIAYGNTNIDPKTKQLLELITEKDLVICILESIGYQSLPRLGYLLSKNDYPLPLLYEVYDDRNNCLKEKINFEIFKDLLSFTSKPLAIVSGTSSSIRKGKSSLIPFMFSGLNKNSVFGVRKKTPAKNSIDIICNEESSNNWIIADFNGELTGKNMVNLFKSLSANASLHILNANINDFDKQTGEPRNEILNFFKHYKSQRTKNQLKLVVLIRDFSKQYSTFLELIKKRVDAIDSNVSILIVENWFYTELEEDIINIQKDEFKKNFQKVLDNTENQKFHSIQDVKSNYDRLISNLGNFISDSEETWVEKKFYELFGQNGKIKIEVLREMFKLSDIYKNIEINENKLFRLNFHEVDSNEKKRIYKILDVLKKQLKSIEPKSDAIKFFIKILESEENFMTDLSILEKCLINFKKEELEKLRKQREKLSNEFSILDNKIKIEQNSLKTDILIDDMKKKKTELQDLDEKIKAIDLTLDKFWDELFLYFDWLDQCRKADKDLKDLVIDRYIKLVQNGYIIGEQSSAKSSLLNSLFGCDFRTSAGRCTIGIYMNFVTYGDKTIVILDTEGLASVESGKKFFDNQMATMAVFSSHLIVINHKGEISSNLEKILGITFYAKIHLSNHSFKPFIMFVLRDQIDRNESSINGQVSKVKEGLIKDSKFVGTSLDDVLNLDPKHLTLLSNAFSEDYCQKLNIKIKWRNKIFPGEVLELRKKLMQQIDLVNEENVIKNFLDLYTNLNSHWETISETGENIFYCKDLEEIKIRENEIFDDSIEAQCKHDIERCVEERKEKVNQEFDSLTNKPYYPKSIVDEYGKKISYQFEWLKVISIQRLNENCIYLKNMSEYNNLISEINDLLAKNNHYNNIDAFITDIEEKIEKINQINLNRLNSMIQPVDKLIENIERMLKYISASNKEKEYFTNDFNNIINVENWYPGGISNLKDKFSFKAEEAKKENSKFKEEIKNYIINRSKELVHKFEESNLQHCTDLKISKDLISDTLDFLETELSHPESIVQEFHLDSSKKAKDIYKMKQDANKLGSTVANDFMTKLFNYLIQIETLFTPNELIELAFKLSFEVSNYQNVYKYVIDVNRYCKEKKEIKNLYHDLLKDFLDFDSTKIISSCREFFETLEEEVKKKKYYESDSIIGTNISNFAQFILSFKKSIGNFYNELNIKLEEFNNELDKRCKSEIIDYIDTYIGCNSRCPCCGSKCQNAKRHQGNHCSQFHILNGFYKYSNTDTKEIQTYFCWEEETFINSRFYLRDKHPDWLSDIQKNYAEYGKNPSNLGNIIFRNQIMRAWMNT
ncbi:interferon-induced very large GTPase 1-like, partial [Brachionus plicatilis]